MLMGTIEEGVGGVYDRIFQLTSISPTLIPFFEAGKPKFNHPEPLPITRASNEVMLVSPLEESILFGSSYIVVVLVW